jgi:serine/threonine-protein kinase RsbW
VTHQFERAGIPADADSAGLVRDELGRWLRDELRIGGELVADVTLATYEGMVNIAEHAYPYPSLAAPMSVLVRCDPRIALLAVTLSDSGTWRASNPAHQHLRGNGIPLMRALADRCTIDSSAAGTQVNLQWYRLLG